MGFNIRPNFNIFIDSEVFFQNNLNFEEIINSFLDIHPVYNDILDIEIEEDDSKFFKQFSHYAQLVRPCIARHLLYPFADHKSEWMDVVLGSSLYNPFETFVMMQLAFYISKKQPKSSISFVVGYEDIYKNTISIFDGEIAEITGIIFDYSTYEEYASTDNLTISMEELAYIFKKLNEKGN